MRLMAAAATMIEARGPLRAGMLCSLRALTLLHSTEQGISWPDLVMKLCCGAGSVLPAADQGQHHPLAERAAGPPLCRVPPV